MVDMPLKVSKDVITLAPWTVLQLIGLILLVLEPLPGVKTRITCGLYYKHISIIMAILKVMPQSL